MHPHSQGGARAAAPRRRVPSVARHGQHLAAAAALLTLAACSDGPPSSDLGPLAGPRAAVTKGGPSGAPTSGTNTLRVGVSGLPAGTAAAVTVSGPNGYSVAVQASTSLAGLANGTYTVAGAPVTTAAGTYAASPATQSMNVKNGRTVSAAVSYAAAPTTGTLAVTVSIGEPVPAAVTVTGPDGFSRSVAASQTLTDLAPGAYTVAAAPTTSTTGTTYTPSPASQAASVQVGATAAAAVSYVATAIAPSADLNLRILGMYLTQSVQTMGGAVPLVAGRDGVLRVFAVASAANTVKPSVRVRALLNGSLAATFTAPAPTASVPTALNEGSATASWNVRIPGALVQPGLSILADVDPDGVVAEADEGDNQFPVSGSPHVMNVRTLPGLALRFVPVTQAPNGLTGNISSANAEAFLQNTRDMLPTGAIQWTVRAPYTTSLALGSDGTNWSAVLSELRALRTAEGLNDHYYGVVRTSYGGGVVGVGSVGGPTSMGFDGSGAGETLAHELGHNWGRSHSPCGGVSSYDQNYPYAGGVMGAFGWNVRTSAVIPASTGDLMGYCRPRWSSDYTYRSIFSFRSTSTAGTITSATAQDGLLLWGRVDRDGNITLEPAVRMTGRSVLPAEGGSFTLEGTDAAGARLFSVAFEPEDVSEDVDGDEQLFAFLVPLSEVDHGRLQTVRVHGWGRSAERSARFPARALERAASAATLESTGAAGARLRWSASELPLVVVRDAGTGEVLSLARGGDVALQSARAELELIVSDGVRSGARRVRVIGR